MNCCEKRVFENMNFVKKKCDFENIKFWVKCGFLPQCEMRLSFCLEKKMGSFLHSIFILFGKGKHSHLRYFLVPFLRSQLKMCNGKNHRSLQNM